MEGPRERRGQPSVLSIVVVSLATLWVVKTEAEWVIDAWRYPLLNKRVDPIRTLYVADDFVRHVELARSGKEKLETGDHWQGSDDWGQLFAEIRHAANRNPVDGLPERARWAIAVLSAGWGYEKGLEYVRTIGNGPPAFLARRVDEIRRDEYGPDLARARLAHRYHSWLTLAHWLSLAAAPLSLVALWKLVRRRPLPSGSVALPLGKGLFLFLVFMGVPLAASPFLGELWGASAMLAAPLATGLSCAVMVVLVRRAIRAADDSAWVRALALPRDRAGKAVLVLAALLTFGALEAFEYASLWLTARADFRPPDSAWIVEGVLYADPLSAFLSGLACVVFAPVGEELAFRGALFGGLSRHLSIHGAALFSALVFSVVHAAGLVDSVSLVVIGYCLARLYARTGSLLPGMLVHASMNLLGVAHTLAARLSES